MNSITIPMEPVVTYLSPRTKMDVVNLAVIFGLPLLINGLAPVPKRQIGFVYNEGSPTAKVQLDLYIDQMCPDSKAAFPTLLTIADHYGPQNMRLNTRVFSAAYIRNGYLASKASYFVHSLSNTSMTYSYIGKVFSQVESFRNKATQDQSDNQVIERLADLAAGMGLQKAQILAMFSNGSLEWAARVAWKHAATRKIFEVPTFFLNDVMIEATPKWSVADWRKLLDPLLGIQQKTTVVPTNRSELKTTVVPTNRSERVSSGIRMWAWLGVLFLCMKM